MQKTLVGFVALLCCSLSCAPPDTAAGTSAALEMCSAVPSIGAYDLDAGLDAAPTGDRNVYSPTSYSGTDYQKVVAALAAAGNDPPGAVVLDRVYVMDGATPRVPSGVMLTGGGLRRSCAGSTLTQALTQGESCITVADTTGILAGRVYTISDGTYAGYLGAFTVSSVDSQSSQVCKTGTFAFNAASGSQVSQRDALLGTTPTSWATDVIVDSVLFDGNDRCGTHTHDWRHANTLPIRGENSVRNSVFYDTPSENLTVCGTLVEGNVGLSLGGSFTHGSCASATGRPQTVIARNQIESVNEVGDAIMQHSEGAFTLSVSAGRLYLTGNVLITGGEGVFGTVAGSDDLPILAVGDCYQDFPRLVTVTGGDETEFQLINVAQISIGP